jgi:RNA polymerase sigma-70 factor, ECF subfamily
MAEATLPVPDPAAAEAALLERLRVGDEAAFEALVARHYATMLAVAQTYVKGRAVAEEVVQEAWLGVIKGLDRFEGRSSLKTWILSILVNQAKTRGAREARSVPFTSLAPEGEEAAVDPARFRSADESYPGHWRAFPGDWGRSAATAVQDRETLRVVMGAIAGLPDAQQTVIRMRDVEGFSSAEVCDALGVSEGNQRVLLHRARSKVRAAVEEYLDPEIAGGEA